MLISLLQLGQRGFIADTEGRGYDDGCYQRTMNRSAPYVTDDRKTSVRVLRSKRANRNKLYTSGRDGCAASLAADLTEICTVQRFAISPSNYFASQSVNNIHAFANQSIIISF
jgi:hypothetical protein